MISVKIDIYRHGHPVDRDALGTLVIYNTGEGTALEGDYGYIYRYQWKGLTQEIAGFLEGQDRTLPAHHLVSKVLRLIVEDE